MSHNLVVKVVSTLYKLVISAWVYLGRTNAPLCLPLYVKTHALAFHTDYRPLQATDLYCDCMLLCTALLRLVTNNVLLNIYRSCIILHLIHKHTHQIKYNTQPTYIQDRNYINPVDAGNIYVCDSPVYKSTISPSCILITALRLKHCMSELQLRAGLICAS